MIQCNEALKEVTLYQNVGGKSLARTFKFDRVRGARQVSAAGALPRVQHSHAWLRHAVAPAWDLCLWLTRKRAACGVCAEPQSAAHQPHATTHPCVSTSAPTQHLFPFSLNLLRCMGLTLPRSACSTRPSPRLCRRCAAGQPRPAALQPRRWHTQRPTTAAQRARPGAAGRRAWRSQRL